jgi:hypothetical protein
MPATPRPTIPTCRCISSPPSKLSAPEQLIQLRGGIGLDCFYRHRLAKPRDAADRVMDHRHLLAFVVVVRTDLLIGPSRKTW